MKAHHLLFPILLIVGVGECVALNMMAGQPGPAEAAKCPDPPKCPPTPSVSKAVPTPEAVSDTAKSRPSPGPSAKESDEQPREPAPPPGAIQLPFAPQSALFEPHARSEMFKIARAMKDDPSKKLHLIGHSDVNSDGDRAEGLPERRARSCHDFIVQLGVANDRVSYETRAPSKSTTAAESGRHRAVTAIWQ